LSNNLDNSIFLKQILQNNTEVYNMQVTVTVVCYELPNFIIIVACCTQTECFC